MQANPVYIKWKDATSVDAWEDLKVALKTKCATIHTIGFLIESDEHRHLVAMNIDRKNDAMSCHIAIPIAWVQELLHFPPLDDLRP